MARSLAKLKLLWNAWTVLDRLEGDLKTMSPKALWKSKTFWLNVIATALQFGLPDHVPQPWGMYVLAGLNIATRLLTKQPVTLTVS